MNYAMRAHEKERDTIVWFYSDDLTSLMNAGICMGKSNAYHEIEIRGHAMDARKLIWWYPKD